jgi:hypothetical protein
MSVTAAARSSALPPPRRDPALIPLRRDPGLAYLTGVNPGSGLQFVSSRAGFRLAGQVVNSLDAHLSAGPSGLLLAWPSPAMLATLDGGRRWRTSLSVTDGLWGIDFIDPARAWAVGVTALYRTVDGGGRWHRVAEPGAGGGHALVRVAFTGVNTGFGLTTKGRPVQTDDAGATWSKTGWTGHAGALCVQSPNALTIADQSGGIWRSTNNGVGWVQIAPDFKPVEQYLGWWVDLSCEKGNGVEFAQAFCAAACGGGVISAVRQTTDAGVSWRLIAQPSYGAANPAAPVLARVVAVGDHGACLIYDPTVSGGVLIRCTSDGGHSFQRATVPPVPHSRDNTGDDVFAQGVSFADPSRGWLMVADGAFGTPKAPRAQTEVWSTNDGGATWQTRSQGPIQPIPPYSP